MRKVILPAAFLYTTLFISCCQTKNTTANAGTGSEALFQKEWKLFEVQGTALSSGSKAMMLLTAGQPNKISGSTGCNRMSGSFELSETNSIKFLPLAITKMACLNENANDTEKKFIAALEQANNWSIQSDILTLKNNDNIVARLIAMPVSTEQTGLNGTWELNYISGPRIAFEGLFPNKKPTLIFNLPNEEATGNGGCNGYSVKIKVDGNKISFGDALSTMMACEGNGEPLYFKTLKTITAYSINENTLNLIMGDIAVMRFSKK